MKRIAVAIAGGAFVTAGWFAANGSAQTSPPGTPAPGVSRQPTAPPIAPHARLNTSSGTFWIIDGKVQNARHPEQQVPPFIIERFREQGWIN